MPAVEQDLVVEQGTDWAKGWMVLVHGAPIDQTWTARSQVRSKIGTLLHEFDTGITPEGAVVISVTPEQSSIWHWRDGFYDVKVSNLGGSSVLRVAQGEIRVSRQVTE